MIVIKCTSENDLMRQFSLLDDFDPTAKYLLLPEYLEDRYQNELYETEQQGLGFMGETD